MELLPGVVAREELLELRGRVVCRRDHSKSVSFVDVEEASVNALSGPRSAAFVDQIQQQMMGKGNDHQRLVLQACFNTRTIYTDSAALRVLALLDVGDSIVCTGHPGRTRTGCDNDSITFFPAQVTASKVAVCRSVSKARSRNRRLGSTRSVCLCR